VNSCSNLGVLELTSQLPRRSRSVRLSIETDIVRSLNRIALQLLDYAQVSSTNSEFLTTESPISKRTILALLKGSSILVNLESTLRIPINVL